MAFTKIAAAGDLAIRWIDATANHVGSFFIALEA